MCYGTVMSLLVLRGIIIFSVILPVHSSHFRGGTISWSLKQGKTVEFKFKMGWTYGNGPGCTETKIGQFVNNTYLGDKDWKCVSGCPSVIVVGTANYYCTAASSTENWEQGENTFTHTFTGSGPYTVSYTGSAWMKLSYGQNNDWNIQTIVDLRPRSDNNLANSSPITASKPMYTLQFKCHHELQIPMIDSDGDRVKCRWATGKECASVCKALPVADLVEDTCTLVFTANSSNQYVDDGWYAVALTIEDYPRQNITIGNQTYTVNDSISAVPLQFLIHIVGKPEPCDWKPEFVSPTPVEGSVIRAKVGTTLNLKFYAANPKNPSSKIIDVSLTSPSGLTVSNLQTDTSRPSVAYWDLTWTPRLYQKGDSLVCAVAENDKHQMSNPRCITISTTDTDVCLSNPCQNGGTCQDKTNRYTCLCPAGFTGNNCQTDIDECKSSPCLNGGSCVDKINGYSCACPAGITGRYCQTDIDECNSNPCINGGACADKINAYSCACPAGITGTNCQTDIDECISNPCLNGGSCADKINGYSCACPVGITGRNCQTDINECASSPCQNGGTCMDGINSYTCRCKSGYIGTNCQTEINECISAPCLNSGACVDDIGGFNCLCRDGFSGSFCQTDIDECLSHPCLNGGSCKNGIASYQCSCLPGYTGINCETKLLKCASQPCKNNGTCIDMINAYQCHCAPGYTGHTCGTDIDECKNNPCLNGATCTDQINGYSCSCALGFFGKHCEKGRDHCWSNPCVNNGTCVNNVTTYECICPPDTTDINCDVKISSHMTCPRLEYSDCECTLSSDPFRTPKVKGQTIQPSEMMASALGFLLGLITTLLGYRALLSFCGRSNTPKNLSGSKTLTKPETLNYDSDDYGTDLGSTPAKHDGTSKSAVTNIYRTVFNSMSGTRSTRVETSRSDW